MLVLRSWRSKFDSWREHLDFLETKCYNGRMVKKPVKLGAMVLLGTVLFVYSPAVAYAYSPYVTTGSATAITSSTAILNGSVNADNMPTSVWFEYSTDSGT